MTSGAEELPGPGARYGFLAAGLAVVLGVLYLAATLASAGGGPTTTGAVGREEGRFLDPVSGEEVDPATAPYEAEVFGRTFYFASRESLERFQEDPLRYSGGRIRVKVEITQPGEAPTVPALPVSEEEADREEEPLPDPEGPMWTEARDPPPAVPEALPPPPEEPSGTGDPAWLPPDPSSPAAPSGEQPGRFPAPPPPEGPRALPPPPGLDDVLIQPVPRTTSPQPVKDQGEVILEGETVRPGRPVPSPEREGTPGPAGPPQPLGL